MSENKNVSQTPNATNHGGTIPEYVTEEMRTLLRSLADLANQVSDEVYDDDDTEHGTAGILGLCDLLVTKLDAYLED